MPLYFLMAIFPYTTGSHCRQVTIFLENVRFRNMRIMTLISIVSWLPMASSTSPFTYGAVEVIFGSIYFYFHLQTAPDLQDCPHSTNLPTIPESTLYNSSLKGLKKMDTTEKILQTMSSWHWGELIVESSRHGFWGSSRSIVGTTPV